MGKKSCTAVTILVVVSGWLLFTKNQNNEDEKAKIRPTQKANLSEPLKFEKTISTETRSSHLQTSEIVSLDEISNTSTAEETALLFQRISVELINELNLLEKTTDSNRIRSKISPVVSKLYYLNRASAAELREPQKRLPIFFREDIANLEQLWIRNQTLARTADDLFSDFGLLQYEHIPYQLREELSLQ